MADFLFDLPGQDPFELNLDWLPAGGFEIGRGTSYARRFPAAKNLASSTLEPPEPLTSEGMSLETLAVLGTVTQVFGALGTAAGAYYQADATKGEADSVAMSLEHESIMAEIDARHAEFEAQSILDAGQDEVARLTMAAGAAKSASRASIAGRGIRLGVGSAAETQASFDYIKDVEKRALRINAVRAANVARGRRVALQNRALLGRVSAANMRRSARTISPVVAGFGAGLGAIANWGG